MQDTANESPADSELTEEQAKIFGFEFDPDNPIKLKDLITRQFAGTIKQLNDLNQDSRLKIEEYRNRIVGKSKGSLTPEQEVDVEHITKILSLHPVLIDSVKIHLATMLRRLKENQSLLNADPSKTLELMDKIQDVLRSEVPEELWPERQDESARQPIVPGKYQ